uniref:BTB domain-containing protein n=1 Tax=Panagrolaimus sp. ES5 TaxID=591445 RepID=A0AC34FQ88_9BILA
MNSTQIEIPILMRWKISKEEIQIRLQKRSILGKIVKLEEVAGILYGIMINKNEKNQIYVYLGFSMKESTTINADFEISIVPSNNFEFIDKFTFKENNQKMGEVLCTYDELFDPANNYFIDGYIYFTLEGILSVERKQQKEVSFESQIKNPNNLGELLWNRDDKDFDIITADKKVVNVHKLVIAAKSPVFDKMIQSGLRESKENQVLIADFDFEIVEIAIKYCYGIQINDSLNYLNGIKLLQFSDKYDISDLKDSMEEYLFKQKSPMNVCEIVNGSIISNSIKLRQKCFDYMLECMKSSIFINGLDILDKDFALKLLKACFLS